MIGNERGDTSIRSARGEAAAQERGPAARPDEAKLATEPKEHVRKQLPGIKVPRGIEFPAELPKTATGKILRFRRRG